MMNRIMRIIIIIMILNMIMMINFQVSQRKLSTDFVRKLSAISVASDVSCISGRFIIIIILLIIIIIIIIIVIMIIII